MQALRKIKNKINFLRIVQFARGFRFAPPCPIHETCCEGDSVVRNRISTVPTDIMWIGVRIQFAVPLIARVSTLQWNTSAVQRAVQTFVLPSIQFDAQRITVRAFHGQRRSRRLTSTSYINALCKACGIQARVRDVPCTVRDTHVFSITFAMDSPPNYWQEKWTCRGEAMEILTDQ